MQVNLKQKLYLYRLHDLSTGCYERFVKLSHDEALAKNSGYAFNGVPKKYIRV